MGKEQFTCPACQKQFSKYHFSRHIKIEHDVKNIEEFYIKHVLNGIIPLCKCGCGKQLRFSNWKDGYPCKYVRGHNAVDDSSFKNPKQIKKNVEKRREGYKSGKYSAWNKGLTAKSSKKIAESSKKASETIKRKYASGELVPWQTGLTKETDDRIARSSETKKSKYKKRELRSWNEGLTRETDKRVELSAKKISNSYNSREAGRRLSVEELEQRLSKFSDKFILVSDQSDYKTRKSHLSFRCTTCNLIQKKSLSMLESTPICHNCYPKESKGQLEMYEFVKSLVQNVELSNREALNGKELDIYVPDMNFAIEYNGLYWHSSKFLKSGYHDEKIKAAISSGIDLIMVYEDEWRDKREIIESMIRHRLGIHERRIGARKLHVKVIDSRKEAREFFNAYHLEGYANSKKIYGLYTHEEELVAAMSLRKPFHRGYSSVLEVGRSCVKSGISVPGWIGKLTKFARKDSCCSLITYVDSRVGQGKSYMKAGWEFKTMTASPRFWWTDYVSRFNRFAYRANKSRGMTQRQVADEAGIVEIFGSRNSILTYS